jgi:glycosyltransferase involved in cell wall biosynthesis
MTPSTIEQVKPVSVIIPVYNSEKYLSEAIESVLAQTYQAFELIIIDDGSSDRSREIATSYPMVNYIYQQNSGVAAARNKGIKIAKGDFLAFLDADDLWMPEKLALQMEAFARDPSLEIVTGYVEQFISPELAPEIARKYSFPDRPLQGYSPGAITIRRNTFKKTGLFHEDFQGGEAISWFAYLLEQDVKMFCIPEVVTKRRIHGGNISLQNKDGKEKTIIHILKETLDRRRTKNL